MADAAPSLTDLDLRLVRYFTVVAEHQNFGRAAAALRVAQPSLSRQVQRLEDQLGVRLLDRTSHGSSLTEAGQVFLPQAQALLRSARRAMATTRAAAPAGSITVGYVSDFIITAAVRELRRRYPAADVRTLHLDWDSAHTALPEHRVDAIVGRTPFPFAVQRLRVTVLYEGPRVLVVPGFHRLAGKESVTVDDFADEPLVRFPGTSTAWGAFWRLEPRADGRPAPGGPVVETLEDKLEVVASGQALAILPGGYQHGGLRPDLVTVPIEAIEPCRVVIVTRAGERNRLVAAFRECARDAGGRARRCCR